MVITVEDVGFGEPQAPVLINALYQMLLTFDRQTGGAQALRAACGALSMHLPEGSIERRDGDLGDLRRGAGQGGGGHP